MSIYAKIKETKDLNYLLKQLFNTNVGEDVSTVATFKDKECTVLQCVAGKYRSFDSILQIVKTYIPEITVQNLIKEMLIVDIKNKYDQTCDLIMMNCSGIEKINLVYGIDNELYPYTCALELDKYNSQYSWEELLNMIGIDSDKKLKEFIKNKV